MPILGILASRDGGTPTAPTIGTATAGDASATVAYTASIYTGKGAATYLATSSPGSLTGTGASPITVSGLTNGTAYTFTVKATSTTGETATSAASNSITPITPSSYESIATASPTSGNVVTFSSIPSTYKHLQLRIVYVSTASVVIRLQANSDTTLANYAIHQLGGDGTSASASGQTSGYPQVVGSMAGIGTVATYPNVGIVDIADYASTTKNKTIRSFNGGDANGSGTVNLSSALWASTAAISTLDVRSFGGTFATGSTVALYGIKG